MDPVQWTLQRRLRLIEYIAAEQSPAFPFEPYKVASLVVLGAVVVDVAVCELSVDAVRVVVACNESHDGGIAGGG